MAASRAAVSAAELALVIAEKSLGNASRQEIDRWCDVREAGAFELESLGHASVG